jgi:hypothetical protein
MHLSEGEIRAYQDQELSDERQKRLENHLASCTRCKEKAQTLVARTHRIDDHLSTLQSKSRSEQFTARTAYNRFEARLSNQENTLEINKENQNMWNKLTSRIPRPIWATSIVVVILGISLAFPPVRAIANSFLGLFRVEKIQVIQVDTERLPGQLDNSLQFERIFSENVKVEEKSEAQEVSSVSEASDLAGMPVRLSAALEAPQKIMVQPGGSVTFQIDLELVRAVLEDIDRSDIKLPDSLDGTSVRLDFQGGVVTFFGNCNLPDETKYSDPDDPGNSEEPPVYDCTSLMQAFSPTISAPPDLDINSIGEAYLQLLGMSREEAANFSSNVDWTTTFILPVPRYSADYQEVQVDGATGVLITSWGYKQMQFTLLWVKDGMVYALNGPGDENKALEIANSLK